MAGKCVYFYDLSGFISLDVYKRQIMSKIYLPLSKPSIATVTLFSLINHWNSWFDGLIYSNFTDNYPLQSYLQTMVAVSYTHLNMLYNMFSDRKLIFLVEHTNLLNRCV